MSAFEKRRLPTVRALSSFDGPPTPDAAREALGGRWVEVDSSLPGMGCRFLDSRGRVRQGVVVAASRDSLDVWIGDGRFQRIAVGRAEFFEVEATDELAHAAADARIFGAMNEGVAVQFLSRDGSVRSGTLVERCRYGALVAAERQVFAVAFRRLWPAVSSDR